MGLDSSHNIVLFLTLSLTYSGCVFAASEQEQADTISAYKKNIKQLEFHYGVYSEKLVEQMLGLGLFYQTQNDHKQAALMLERALQNRRINNGLYDLTQIPILENLIKSNVINGDWSAVDRNYQQILWLHKRNYDYTAPELLAVLDRVGQWKLVAYSQYLTKDNSLKILNEAKNIYNDALTILSSSYSETDPRLIRLLYGQALVNYNMAFYISNLRYESDKAESRSKAIIKHIYKVGKVLKRLVAIYEASPELEKKEYANALVHLGDWHLLQKRLNSAHEVYNKAYSLLDDDADNQKDLERLFSEPKSIPTLQANLAELNEYQINEDEQTEAFTSFNVSKKGRARNIKILEIKPSENVRTKRTVKNTIKLRQYRPRYENGEPVVTYDHKMRIVLAD